MNSYAYFSALQRICVLITAKGIFRLLDIQYPVNVSQLSFLELCLLTVANTLINDAMCADKHHSALLMYFSQYL